MRKMHGAQRSDHQGRAGGAIGVEIADHEHPARPMRREQFGRRIDAIKSPHRQQPIQR